MYSKTAWGGDVDPFISAKFIQVEPGEGEDVDPDPTVSVVVFEWRDEDLVGVWPSDDATEVFAIDQDDQELWLMEQTEIIHM